MSFVTSFEEEEAKRAAAKRAELDALQSQLAISPSGSDIEQDQLPYKTGGNVHDAATYPMGAQRARAQKSYKRPASEEESSSDTDEELLNDYKEAEERVADAVGLFGKVPNVQKYLEVFGYTFDEMVPYLRAVASSIHQIEVKPLERKKAKEEPVRKVNKKLSYYTTTPIGCSICGYFYCPYHNQ